MIDRIRLRVGAVAIVAGSIAYFVAQMIRPDHAEDAAGILASVQASAGSAGGAALLYLAAAILLVGGLVAISSSLVGRPGARTYAITTALTAVGAAWLVAEAVIMTVAATLAASPDHVAAAAQLNDFNDRFGLIAILPWFLYLAPLGMAIGLRRGGRSGVWLVGLWAVGFVIGFAANSPLGESVPALALIGDAALAALLAAIGVVAGWMPQPVADARRAAGAASSDPADARAMGAF